MTSLRELDHLSLLVSSHALVKDAADNSRDGRLMAEERVELSHLLAFGVPQFRRSKKLESKSYDGDEIYFAYKCMNENWKTKSSWSI